MFVLPITLTLYMVSLGLASDVFVDRPAQEEKLMKGATHIASPECPAGGIDLKLRIHVDLNGKVKEVGDYKFSTQPSLSRRVRDVIISAIKTQWEFSKTFRAGKSVPVNSYVKVHCTAQ